MDPEISPKSLLDKVQWYIRFYFAHCGSENMYGMLKNHFKVTYDDKTDIHYVKLAVDEETKNQKEVDKDIDSPFMPEIRDAK